MKESEPPKRKPNTFARLLSLSLVLILGGCDAKTQIQPIPFEEIEETDELGQKIRGDIKKLMLERGFEWVKFQVSQNTLSEWLAENRQSRRDPFNSGHARFVEIELSSSTDPSRVHELAIAIEDELGEQYTIIHGVAGSSSTRLTFTIVKNEAPE